MTTHDLLRQAAEIARTDGDESAASVLDRQADIAERIDSPCAILIDALRKIRDQKPDPFPWPPEGWREAREVCAECKRYEGHPIQKGICDEHRRPMHEREAHDQFEIRALGARASLIARDALYEWSRATATESSK